MPLCLQIEYYHTNGVNLIRTGVEIAPHRLVIATDLVDASDVGRHIELESNHATTARFIMANASPNTKS